MARMVRLLRAIPELLILVKAIFVASRAVFFTLLLLTILLYFFAIMFKQLADGSYLGEQYFSTVPASMASLLLDGILLDEAAIGAMLASGAPRSPNISETHVGGPPGDPRLGEQVLFSLFFGCRVFEAPSETSLKQLTYGLTFG